MTQTKRSPDFPGRFKGAFSVATLPAAYQLSWRWWNDPLILKLIPTLGPLPPVPSLPGTSNQDVFAQKGRLWSFVSETNGSPSKALGNAALAYSVYSPLEIDEFGPPLPLIPIPRLGPRAAFLPCPECPGFASLLTVDHGDPANTKVDIFMAPSAQRIDITSQFTEAALANLSIVDSQLIPASEPSYLLTTSDLSAVMLRSDGNIPATFTTDFRTGRIDAGGVGSDPPSPPGPPDGAQVTLGGRRQAVFAAGTVDDSDANHHHHRDCHKRHRDQNGDGEEEIWINLAISPGWVQVPIAAAMHGQVLGVTVAGSAHSTYYVLDQVHDHGAWLRLYSFTEGGRATELVRWHADDMRATSLTTSYDGGLLVALSDDRHHQFLHFSVDGGGSINRVTRSDGDGSVAIEPRALRGGVAWGKALDREHVAAMRTDLSEFRTEFRTCQQIVGEANTTNDFVSSVTTQARFLPPASIQVVRGNAGNGTATITFVNGGSNTVCSYRGGASSTPPSSDADRIAGLAYNLVGCSSANGITASSIRVHVEGDTTAGATDVQFTVSEAPGSHPLSGFGSLQSSCR